VMIMPKRVANTNSNYQTPLVQGAARRLAFLDHEMHPPRPQAEYPEIHFSAGFQLCHAPTSTVKPSRTSGAFTPCFQKLREHTIDDHAVLVPCARVQSSNPTDRSRSSAAALTLELAVVCYSWELLTRYNNPFYYIDV